MKRFFSKKKIKQKGKSVKISMIGADKSKSVGGWGTHTQSAAKYFRLDLTSARLYIGWHTISQFLLLPSYC